MATLLLDRADLEVRITDGALALYENGTRSQTVPLRLIDRVVIQGARTKLDTAVLLKLAEAGAATPEQGVGLMVNMADAPLPRQAKVMSSVSARRRKGRGRCCTSQILA